MQRRLPLGSLLCYYAVEMKAKTVTRGLFLLLLVFEAVGWAGLLPWTPTYSWIGLIVTALAVWACVELIDLPSPLWPLFFVGLLLDATADTFQLYYHVTNWDRLMHLVGGALIAVASWYSLKPLLPATVSVRWRIILVLAMVALVGTMYEGMEWGVDAFYSAAYDQDPGALGNGIDTVEDQLLNLVGGLIVVGIAEYRRKR